MEIFFKKHQKEVEAMMMTVIPPEQAIEFMKLDEYNQGVEEGKRDTIIDLARNMLKNNLSIDIIATNTGLSREGIEKL